MNQLQELAQLLEDFQDDKFNTIIIQDEQNIIQLNKQFLAELTKVKDLVQEIEDISALQNDLINSMHAHNKKKIDELLKDAFILGEDIDDGIYEIA
jgi:predicted lactoylglutathione lyase